MSEQAKDRPPRASLLARAGAMLSVYHAEMVAYRAEIFLWALSGVLPLIMMGLWVEAGRQGQFVMGSADFARYFLAVWVVRQTTTVWVIYEFEYNVLRGRLSSMLLQPADPAWRYIAMHLAERLARAPLTIAIVAVFFFAYPEAIWLPSAAQVGLGVLAIVLSFALRFAMQYTSAMLAFWTERASSIEQTVFLLQLFLSGTVAPLEVFPPIVRQAALWTPFPYIVWFPASLWIHPPTELPVLRGFAILVAWLLVFLVGNRLLWRAGLKRYSAMGA